MASFHDRVYALVRRIPRGRVVSYGGVAAMLGEPRAARGVGMALSALSEPHDVPWWRVVNREGRISSPRIHHIAQIQRALLEGEGVEFDERDRIPWERYGWSGNADPVEGPSPAP